MKIFDTQLQPGMEIPYQELVENAREVFFVQDPATHQVLYVSPSFEKVWGIEGEKLYEFPTYHLEAIHPRDRSVAMESYLKSLNGEGRIRSEYRILTPHRGLRKIASRSFLVQNGPRRGSHVVTIAQDITEAIVDSSEAVSPRSYTHDNFVDALIHDLKNPLDSIKGLTDLIARELHLEEHPHLHEYLQLITKLCQNSRTLIQDLLQFRELEEESHPFSKEEYDLVFLTKEITQVYQSQAHNKGLFLHFSSSVPELRLSLDRTAFYRLMQNLISNALKFTKTGGVEIEIEVKGSQAEIQVEDTGIGIPPELVSSLFEPFTPARRKGLRGESTSGLGLSICRKIVELHGGSIRLDSEEGSGTCFRVLLPLLKS